MKESPDPRHPTVLVVEDSEEVRKLVCGLLQQSGYGVCQSANGPEALCLLETRGDSIDLVLTDVLMPAMNGRELASRLARVRPRLPVLFMSGFSEDPVVLTLERGNGDFLAKPFTAQALIEKVQKALEASRQGTPLAHSDSCSP